MPSRSSLLHRLGWLAGLPVLVLVWAGATRVTAPVVADALRAGSGEIVRDTGAGEPEPWLRIEVEGRDLLALGEAPDGVARDAALRRLAAIPGLRRLADGTGLIEAVSPFVWRVTRDGAGHVETGGYRPAETGAAALAARLVPVLPPGASLRDRARAARGGPAGFTEAAVDLTGRLRGLAPGAVATLSDTVISVRGEALDAAAYDAARTPPPLGFGLGAVEILPPLVGDFRLALERRPDGGLTLSGHTVSESARAEIRGWAAALLTDPATGAPANAAVEDALQTARGLDPSIDPAALAKAVLRLAGLIRDGAVRFERGSLSVSGTALDEEAVGEAEAILREGRPAGVSAGRVELGVRPVSPYTVRLRREGGGVILSGYLPDRAARESLLAALRARFARETVTDRSRISSGAPPQLLAALTAATGPLSTLADGEAAVSDRSLRLAGESLYPESGRRAGEDLRRALPPGWVGTAAVGARDARPAYDAPTCARLLAERLAGRTLRFAPGSSELRPDFYPVLDAVAELAKACRAERIEVVGHIDPPGAPAPKPATLPEAKSEKGNSDKAKADTAKKSSKATDRKPAVPAEKPAESEPAPNLATARAAAVVDYLQKAGVASDRALVVQGGAPLSERQGIGLALRS